MNENTISAIAIAKRQAGSWRKLASMMDGVVSHATLASLVNRPTATVSPITENKIRCALGLPPAYVPSAPCPTCGELHAIDDCHGQPGTVAWRKPPQDTRKRTRIDITNLSPAGQAQVLALVTQLREEDGR